MTPSLAETRAKMVKKRLQNRVLVNQAAAAPRPQDYRNVMKTEIIIAVALLLAVVTSAAGNHFAL
jgi:hypothetical protein